MNKTTLNDSLLELEQANLIEIWLDDDSVVVQLASELVDSSN